MGSRVAAFLERQRWRPGPAGMLVNPFYLARKGLLNAVTRLAGHVRGRTLDVGCGQKPYAGLFATTAYVGLELDTPANRASKQADSFYDGKTFPFADGEFDSVVCNQVLEHVFEPDRFLAEIRRVLKGDGTLLLTVPFVWDEHEQPYDYGRYTSFGLKYLLERHGFRIVEQAKTTTGVAALFQLVNAHLYKVTHGGSRWVNGVATLLLMAPFNLLGALLAKVTPGNDDLYLDQVVLATKEE